jgi:hypothetical protein
LIVAVPANPVGNVQPVYVSIANGTGSPMLESSGEIFALGSDGNRVPALPPQEAANQAGGSAGLASSVETAAAYAAPSAAGGAATAAVGSALSGGSIAQRQPDRERHRARDGSRHRALSSPRRGRAARAGTDPELVTEPTTIPPNGDLLFARLAS